MVAKSQIRRKRKHLSTDFEAKSKAHVMIKGSAKKLNRILSVLRFMPLPQAMNYLYFCELPSAKPIAKLIKSAAANAQNLHEGLELAQLHICEIYSVKSLTLKRYKAGAKGRMRPINKMYSMLTVRMGTLRQPKAPKLETKEATKEAKS